MAVTPARAPVGSEKAAQQLTHLEQRLEVVRRKFQQYFNGFDRQPPTLEYEALKREFREFQSNTYSTGQARFKAQNLMARWQLQRTIWERDLQKMEEGTYKTGVSRAGRQGQGQIEALDEE